MITDESYNTENLKDPAYWDFYYDARYCGPSRDAYIGMMLDKYRNYDPDIVPNSSPDNQETVEASLIVSKELMAKADREQEAVEREGVHPDYHRYSNGLSFRADGRKSIPSRMVWRRFPTQGPSS